MPRSDLGLGVGLEVLRTHDLVKITLATGETFWLGSGRVVATDPTTATEVEFQPYITNVGDSRQSATLASDRIPLTIHNIDKIFGLLINDAETQLSGATCYFIKYFQDLADEENITTKIVMRGEITDVTTNENDVSFSLISGLSVGLAYIGGQQVQGSCPLTFKSKACGWQISQGGNPNFCDKQHTSAEGCSGHQNQHRFQGVLPSGDLHEIIIRTTHNDDCFIDGTIITLPNGESKPIEQIRVTDLVRSFFADTLEFTDSMVVGTRRAWVDEYFEIKFVSDPQPTGVTRYHPYLNTKRKWVTSNDLKVGDKVFMDGGIDVVESITLVKKRVRVTSFQVENSGTYIANNKLVKNRKILPGV